MKRWIAFSAAMAAAAAWGQGAVMERDWIEPWVPPAVAKSAQALPAPKRGAELRAEVERRLRADFEAAAPEGTLTREQARAAGLGFIAGHFEAIDRRGSGVVRFEDYRAFLKSRGAAFLD